MATNNNGLTPTQSAIREYKIDICKETRACASEVEAKDIDLQAKDKDEQYKICLYVKAEETWTTYRNLDICIGAGAAKESELITKTLDQADAVNKELLKQLQEAVKQIKDAKDKMAAALEVVCKIDRCVEEEERCNLDLYKRLDSLEGFWEALEAIKSGTNECYNKVNRAFNAAVDVSGIQTFANLESLRPFSQKLAEYTAAFHKDITENVKSSAATMDGAGKDLLKVVEELSALRYARCEAIARCEAKDDVYEFVKTLPCPDKAEDAVAKIKEACAKVKNDKLPDPSGGVDCEGEVDAGQSTGGRGR